MSLRGQLKHAWDALAYADAGEFLPYAEKCRVLGVEPPSGCTGFLPPRETAPRRFVALNLGSHLNAATVSYAIGTAQRLEAGLVLLSQSDGPPGDVVAAARRRIEAAGVTWREEHLGTPWIDAMAGFLRGRPSVVCLVLGSSDLDPKCLPATGVSYGNVPVVVVKGDTPLPQPA